MLLKANLVYLLSRLRRQPQNEDDLKIEYDLKNKDDLKIFIYVYWSRARTSKKARPYPARAYTTLVVFVCLIHGPGKFVGQN